MKEWREFLSESEVKYGGILKVKPDPAIIAQIKKMQETLPKYGKRLEEEDLHVTLIHQSILNPFKEQLKNIELPVPPSFEIEPRVFQRKSPGKESWATRLTNQEEMKDYVRQVMEILGSQNTNPEPERVFHITIGNLTGSPFDSVR
jgi:2'-5' RNA ligase